MALLRRFRGAAFGFTFAAAADAGAPATLAVTVAACSAVWVADVAAAVSAGSSDRPSSKFPEDSEWIALTPKVEEAALR